MSPESYQKLFKEGGCMDLSARAKWRLTGMDRVRYLNGQVTNDVRLAKAESALYACVTNLKGKIEGDLCIHVLGDALILDAPEALRESLGVRLERYIIADDAVLEDITDEWRITHCTGPMAEAASNMAELPVGGRSVVNQRFGIAGCDFWYPATGSTPSFTESPLTPEEVETFRILQAIPVSPNELNSDTFPQEAGLEKKAMSYSKGCYIGQEILSRIKSSGKMPRELIAWESLGGGPIQAGDAISLAGKVIGTITSQTRHPVSGHQQGLGFVRQGSASQDSELLVGDAVSSIVTVVKIIAFLLQ
ncbi:MAG: hypothetical protein NTV80_07710 [Verrucomicrobia bacterium]|nr:hypothetical protein [Verrucomicrobiota bacterium]